MAQTKEGALKLAALKAGITIEEYTEKLRHKLKHCYKCRAWRKHEHFHNDKSRSDGLSAICTPCRVIPPSLKKYTKGRTSTFKGKKHTEEAKAKMRDAKLGKPSPKA